MSILLPRRNAENAAPANATMPAASNPANVVEFGLRRFIVVAGVMLAALLQNIDATIVNVALPTIQGNLGASLDEATWIITAYVVANVVVIPMTPWLQLRFGRKQYFLASIAGFTLASVLCGLATSLDELIIFRVIQGAFGGGLLATAQVILRETFPHSQLGLSQAIFALGAVLGPSIGPTLGGIITDSLSWQWVFDINIVPGVLAFVLLLVYQRPPNKGKELPLDYLGVALLISTIGSLQFVLDEGQRLDWFNDTSIVAFFVTTILSMLLFVAWELRTSRPIVDLRVLRRMPVAIAALVSMLNGVGIFSVLLLLPQFTVGTLGFTNTLAGMLIGTRAIPIVILALIVGRITNSGRVSLPMLIGGGLFVTGSGYVWLSEIVTSSASFGNLAPPLMVSGIGIAFIFSPVLIAAVRSVPNADAPKAGSFVALALQLGGSIAAAASVALVQRRSQFHQTQLGASVTLSQPTTQGFLAHHSIASLTRLVTTQAETMAYADAFLVIGCFGVFCWPLVFLLRRRQSAAT